MEDVTSKQVVDLLIEIRDILKSQPTQQNAGGDDEAPVRRYQNEKGKWVYQLPKGKAPSKCRDCKEDIIWVKYINKKKETKNIPCDHDGECHFETCSAKKNRKPFIPMPGSITSAEDAVGKVMDELKDQVPF